MIRMVKVMLLFLLSIFLLARAQDPRSKFSSRRLPGTFTGVTEPRLPKHLKPHFYKLEIVPFLDEGNLTFSGRVVITIEVLEDNSKNVTFHCQDLQILNTTIILKDKTLIPITATEQDEIRNWRIIFTQEDLPIGEIFDLIIDYKGTLRNDSLGFFYQRYEDPITSEVKYLAATQFQDNYARTALPCFDDPSLKAFFQVTIGRKADMRTLSNAPLVQYRSKETNDYVFDVYQVSPRMSTYMLAFVVASFNCSEPLKSNGGVMVRVCSKDMGPTTTYLAETLAPRILDFYERTLEIPYSLTKLDLVGLPNFGGGMENWGLVILGDNLLNDSGIITHEIAHQWFGNYVTMSWWNE